tara:strand:- start:2794 stop:2994 length:201 start_codon:yes stop_codon:yes gene_type:complete
MNPRFKRAPANSKLTTAGFADKVTGEPLMSGKFTQAECDEFNDVKKATPKKESAENKGLLNKMLKK